MPSFKAKDCSFTAEHRAPRFTTAYWKPNSRDLYGNLSVVRSIKRFKCTNSHLTIGRTKGVGVGGGGGGKGGVPPFLEDKTSILAQILRRV